MIVPTMMMPCNGILGKVMISVIKTQSSARLQKFQLCLWLMNRHLCTGVLCCDKCFGCQTTQSISPLSLNSDGIRYLNIVPPAYDNLLARVPILDLLENLHRILFDMPSKIVFAYSMAPYDSNAFETLGYLFGVYQ